MLEGDLYTELQRLSAELDATIKKEEACGEAFARAETAYQVKKTQKALEQKSEGIPVTFINQFIYGDKEVALLREVRNIAEAKYKAVSDKTISLRLQLKIVDAQAGREWTARGNLYGTGEIAGAE